MKKIISSKGFTLIELMVVLSIIAIVAGIIITSSLAIQKSGRDALRVSDLSSIQSAVEQYHADFGYYPFELDFGQELSSGGKIYMSEVPDDPIGDSTYSYSGYKRDVNGNYDICDEDSPELCINYCVYAVLENEPSEVQSDKGPCSLEDRTENYFVTAP